MHTTDCVWRSHACSAPPDSAVACTGCATPWRMCPRASTQWSPPRSAKPSCSPMPRRRTILTKLHSTNPLEQLNKEVKRRADVVGIFPNEASITRLIGAVLLEQNDEWLIQCRYRQIEGMAKLAPPLIDVDPQNFHPWRPDPWPPQMPPKFTPA